MKSAVAAMQGKAVMRYVSFAEETIAKGGEYGAGKHGIEVEAAAMLLSRTG